MAAWDLLAQEEPKLTSFGLPGDAVYVAFATTVELDADYRTEAGFNP